MNVTIMQTPATSIILEPGNWHTSLRTCCQISRLMHQQKQGNCASSPWQPINRTTRQLAAMLEHVNAARPAPYWNSFQSADKWFHVYFTGCGGNGVLLWPDNKGGLFLFYSGTHLLQRFKADPQDKNTKRCCGHDKCILSRKQCQKKASRGV